MASLDSLPPDQRAVLQLVLQRGRSYDDIAQMLSIDRAAVRQRALAAFDAIGPQTRVEADRRALITDYLLGQLPDAVAADTRNRLASSASERAWARVLASELAPLSANPMPDIPSEAGRAAAVPAAAAVAAASAGPAEHASAAPASSEPPSEPTTARSPNRIPPSSAAPQPSDGSGRPRSRLGGAILLIVLIVAVAVVIVIVATGGSSKKHGSSTPTTASAPTTPSTPTGTTTPSGTTTSATKAIAQANLISPTGDKGVGGVAIVVKRGTTIAIVLRAQGLAPNGKHDAYAVWLANPGGTSVLLGYVNPPVTKNGQLETIGQLPANAASYSNVLVTLETVRKPTHPGKIVLEGQPQSGQRF
jgi:hypothetical protein